MNPKKTVALLALALAMTALLTGCMGNDNRPQATPMLTMPPIATIPPSPIPTLPQMTQAPSSAPRATVDWTRDAGTVAVEVEKISEVDKATIVVLDDMALVGVTFDPAYKGVLTPRITDMITDKIKSADARIQKVGVTADEAMRRSIDDMSATIKNGGAVNKADFDAVLAKTAP